MLESLTASTAAITTADLKTHCHIQGSQDDATIDAMGLAAQRLIESETRRTLTEAEWQIVTGARQITLEYGDLKQVVEVATLATDGTATALVVDDDYTVPQLYGARFVYINDSVDGTAFRVKYKSEVNTEALPMLELAVKMTTGHFFEHREEVITGTIAVEMPLGARHIVRHLMFGRF